MPKECAMNPDHIQTISKGKIGPVITVLSSRKISKIRSALLFAPGF